MISSSTHLLCPAFIACRDHGLSLLVFKVAYDGVMLFLLYYWLNQVWCDIIEALSCSLFDDVTMSVYLVKIHSCLNTRFWWRALHSATEITCTSVFRNFKQFLLSLLHKCWLNIFELNNLSKRQASSLGLIPFFQNEAHLLGWYRNRQLTKAINVYIKVVRSYSLWPVFSWRWNLF